MKRLRLLGLGAKLATAGGRPAWTRLSLTAAGFAIGSALLLSAASIVPGVHATDVRRDQQEGREGGPRAKDALRVWGMWESFGDTDVSTSVVEPIGQAPVPPGLTRVPGPGEIVAERLGRAVAGEDRAGIRDARDQRIGIVDGEGEVLRRVSVGDIGGLIEAVGENDPGVGERGQGDVGPGKGLRVSFDARGDRVGKRA